MNVFDFISEDEIADLPEEPSLAFVQIVRIAQTKLRKAEHGNSGEDEADWRALEDGRYGFTNFVLAVGKRFGISPFLEMDVPRQDNFNESQYRQIVADIDHYVTQIVIDSGLRAKRDAIPLAADAKEQIRNYIHGLRTCIDQANFADRKRSALLEKLSRFEAELDKARLSMLAVGRITIEILAVPGALWASSEIASKLVTNVLQVVAESKLADDENRELPLSEKPAALVAPRQTELESLSTDDEDDEIPF